jgi:hypothetical protein
MIIARWQIDARFGHKQEVIDSLRNWNEEIGTKLGWSLDRVRIMTGSVGANESTVVSEVELDSMATLDESWNKLAEMDEHKQWSKDLEPNIVSGSHRWEIYRKI